MTEGIKNVSVQTLRVRRNVTSVHEHLLKVQTPAREINTVAGYIQFLDSLLTKQTARVLALLEAARVGVKENYLGMVSLGAVGGSGRLLAGGDRP